MTTNSKKTFIELRYFSPFDINRIPVHILENLYIRLFAMPYEPLTDVDGFTISNHDLPTMLLIMCDYTELKNGVRKELIKHIK